LKVFRWKLLHFIIPTKKLLLKWKIMKNSLCNFWLHFFGIFCFNHIYPFFWNCFSHDGKFCDPIGFIIQTFKIKLCDISPFSSKFTKPIGFNTWNTYLQKKLPKCETVCYFIFYYLSENRLKVSRWKSVNSVIQLDLLFKRLK
jgi:hypothetical protein